MKKEITLTNSSLFYNDTNLTDLAKKYGTPLKITFLDLIRKRVNELTQVFNKVIEENNYRGNFIYLNANKANYGALEIEESYTYAKGLETSSSYDLSLTKAIFDKYNDKEKMIVCNGFKDERYLSEIIDMANKGYNIVAIIDSYSEYEVYANTTFSHPLEIGLRIHMPSLYSEGEDIQNDRFGLLDSEFKTIVEDVKNHPSLVLSTIHFHQRGFDYEKDKFMENIRECFEKYYVYAKKRVSSVINFDMGGGTPLPVDSVFDYQAWAKLLVDYLAIACQKNDITEPNIISENGKYSVKDSVVNIYKVVGVKNTDVYPWYLLDGSLLIALPEMYALGEEIMVRPINNLDKKMIRARLGGITCDCDDIFYDHKLGYMELPEESKDLLIACIGTGSYQNSMNGKGGTHHCLLPEEIDLVKDGEKEFLRHPLQTIEEMKTILKFTK